MYFGSRVRRGHDYRHKLLGGLDFGDGHLDFGEFDLQVVAVELFRGAEVGVAQEDLRGADVVAGAHGDLTAGPGAEFVDVVGGFPAQGFHPATDAAKGVFGAFGGGAGEGVGVRILFLEVFAEFIPGAELDADFRKFLIFGEHIPAAVDDATDVLKPTILRGGDFAFAQAEADGEPDGFVGVEVGGLERGQGFKGFGDDGVGRDVVFFFVAIAEGWFFAEGGEVVRQSDFVVAVEGAEVFAIGEEAAGLAQAAVGAAEELQGAFVVLGVIGEFAFGFFPLPDEVGRETQQRKVFDFGGGVDSAGFADDGGESVDVQFASVFAGAVGAFKGAVGGEDIGQGGVAELAEGTGFL